MNAKQKTVGAAVAFVAAGLLALAALLLGLGVFSGTAARYTLILDKTEYELTAGQTFCVHARLEPENALIDLTYTSSNESVATVDATGAGVAHSGGVAAIEVRAHVLGGDVTAVCTTVVDAPDSEDAAEPAAGGLPEYPAGPAVPAIPAPTLDEEGFLATDALAAYRAYNADTVAWLYVPGTNICLPVAQSPMSDPEFYLSRGLNQYFKYSGAAFLDAKSDLAASGRITDQQTVIYGHARDTDIFDQLEHRTVLGSWYANPANRRIYLNTTQEKTVWEVFACYYTDVADASVASALSTLNFMYTDAELSEKYTPARLAAAVMDGSIASLMRNNEYAAQTASSWRDRALRTGRYAAFASLTDRTYDDVVVEPGDAVLTLSSCADATSSVRYVVQAKLIARKAA